VASKLEAYLRKIQRDAQHLTLAVGFMDGATYPDGTLVSQVAFQNEYGAGRIPSRPFFRQMIDKNSPSWGTDLALTMGHDKCDLSLGLNRMGERIKGQLQDSIISGDFAGLAPMTIAARRERGNQSTKPLIDTTQMMRSITYRVTYK
jgi:hypothetical protein